MSPTPLQRVNEVLTGEEGARELREIASSLRTALSMAHHALANLEHDQGLHEHVHAGIPSECQRPVCLRLRQDADALENIAAGKRPWQQ